MLLTDLMERSDDGSLEERPDSLNPVGVNVPDNPLLGGVVDRLMAGVMILDSKVRLQFVGVDRFGFVLHRPLDEVMEGITPDVGDSFKSDLAATLDRPSHPSLSGAGARANTLSSTTHKRFVYFDDSKQRRAVERVITHCFPDAVAHVPCRLVTNAEATMQLVSRDTFLGLTHHVDGKEPFSQRDVGVVHDGSGCHGELVAA